MAGRSVLLFILLPPEAPILPEYMNWATNPRFRTSQLLDGMYDVIKDNILRNVIRQDRVFLVELPTTSVGTDKRDSIRVAREYAERNDLRLKPKGSHRPLTSDQKYDVFILFKREKKIRVPMLSDEVDDDMSGSMKRMRIARAKLQSLVF